MFAVDTKTNEIFLYDDIGPAWLGMIDTDDELLSDWDNRDIHKVSHIDPTKRITVVIPLVQCDEVRWDGWILFHFVLELEVF